MDNSIGSGFENRCSKHIASRNICGCCSRCHNRCDEKKITHTMKTYWRDIANICKRCASNYGGNKVIDLVWGARRIKSGSLQYGKVCPECHWIDSIRKDHFAEIVGDSDFPCFEDKQVKCVKCHADGAELHHWAPYYLFGMAADSWPTSYLCKKCHSEWHRKVTPLMNLPY